MLMQVFVAMATTAHLLYGSYPMMALYGCHLSQWSGALKVKTLSVITDCDTDVNTPWCFSPLPSALHVSFGWMCGGIFVVHAGNGSATPFSKPYPLDLEARLCHQTDGATACNLKVRLFACLFVTKNKSNVLSDQST